MVQIDVLVIGGGPAGLAAAISADKEGANVLLVERENSLGGILKQCIHDGFGLIRYGEKLTGPEYAQRFIEEFQRREIACRTQAFVTGIVRSGDGDFLVTLVEKTGLSKIRCRSVILSCGCRERTAKQVSIHGTRPSGVFTAGCAQHFVNLDGEMVAKKCVILGSGDIGLIMARRLTLEGAKVLGVYEAKSEPSGLSRNILQCLEDFDIPLHLSHTVTRVFGTDRLTAVETAEVDDLMNPIPGTEEIIDCDTLILSVGLIPENEIAESLGVPLDPSTNGPYCDTDFMTEVPGVFSCGNALHVNDLVDYVSESGEMAGISAARYVPGRKRKLILAEKLGELQYLVPQIISLYEENDDRPARAVFYFRCKRSMKKAVLSVTADDTEILRKTFLGLKPPEMERFELDLTGYDIRPGSRIAFTLKEAGNT